MGHVNTLVTEFHYLLSRAALQYLKCGLEIVDQGVQYVISRRQVSIGNLCIAIELMLKAFVVKIDFELAFKGMPLEYKLAFHLPDEKINIGLINKILADIRDFKVKMIELDECISCFYGYFPSYKHAYRPLLKHLSEYRNASVHSCLYPLYGFQFDNIAYLSLQLYEILKDDFLYHSYLFLSAKHKAFLKNYSEARVDKVDKAIEKSKKLAMSKDIKREKIELEKNDWEHFIIECPICGSDALLTGDTDIDGYTDEDGAPQPSLIFFANAIECKACHLKLDDNEELRLAGIGVTQDRNEDINDWLGEAYEDDYWS